MEPLGFAFGAAGALGQVLECFEYVYIARNFNGDYQTYQIRLDNARLRLSRWGSSVNLKAAPQKEQDQAERTLLAIYNHFERVEKLSREFADKHHKSGESLNHQETEGAKGLDKIREVLHEKLRKLSLNHQPSKSVLKKTKWAIYSAEHMKDLIENLATLTTELVELFPKAKEEQKALCEREMLEFLESLRTLRDDIGTQDKILAEALKKVLEPTVSTNLKKSPISQRARANNLPGAKDQIPEKLAGRGKDWQCDRYQPRSYHPDSLENSWSSVSA